MTPSQAQPETIGVFKSVTAAYKSSSTPNPFYPILADEHFI